MEKKCVILDKHATDKRVAILAKLFEESGATIQNFGDQVTGARPLVFLHPRFTPVMEHIPENATVFGYGTEFPHANYVSLSNDDEFIRENNHLTALAMQNMIGDERRKILIIGWGKLCHELEKTLAIHELHILNFNPQKREQLSKAYDTRAHFEHVNLRQFQIIINTIPKQVIGPDTLLSIAKRPFCANCITPKIYDLASAPYGFNFGMLSKERFDYQILPALPGKYYPERAALAAFNAINRHLSESGAKQIVLPERKTVVLCITGSSCCYTKLLPVVRELAEKYNVIPVLSANANQKNRFTDIDQFKTELSQITGNNILTTIAQTETLSSNKTIVASIVLPATGNTIAKLANAVTDTPATMAVKALLRNNKPCVIGISTNDALSGNAANIGTLLNRKNYYFIPFSQDDHRAKPFSCVCDFSKTLRTLTKALKGNQLQPILK